MYLKIKEILPVLLRQINKPDTEIGKDLAVSRDTIRRWKVGISQPQPTKFYKIAEYFGITVEQLIGEEPIPGLETKSEYTAGPCPRGFDPDIWREVPTLIDGTLAEFLYEEFPGTVRGNPLTGGDTQGILQILYYLWVRKRKAEKESEEV